VIKKRFSRYYVFFTAIVLMVVPELFFRANLLNTSTTEIEEKITEYIDAKIIEANSKAKILLNEDSSTIGFRNDESPYFLVYKKDKLILWTGNNTPAIKLREIKQIDSNVTCSNLGNGFYLTFSIRKNDKKVVALIPIYSKYKFTNSYLKESFSEGITIPEGHEVSDLTAKKDKSDIPFIYKGKKLFYLSKNESSPTTEISGIIVAIQLLGIFILFLSLVNFGFVFAHSSPFLATIVLITGLFALKFVFSVLSPLNLMKQSDIFNPQIFASNTLDPSLGDFLISFLAVFSCSFYFYRVYFLFLQGNKKRFFFYTGLSCLLMIGSTFLLISGLKNLVLNSQIDFFFKNINSLNNYTIIGVCSLGFGLFAQLFLLSRMRNFFHQYPAMIRIQLLLHISFLALMYYYWEGQYIYQFALYSVLLLSYISWPNRIALSPFNSTAIVLISFSILAATIFFEATKEKERNDRKLLAEHLADTQDPNMEIEVNAFVDKLSSDRYFYVATQLGLLSPSENIENYLDITYFDKILKDYDLKYLFFYNDSLSIYPEEYSKYDLQKHEKNIALSGKSTASKHLYFIYNKIGNVDYLANIPLTHVGQSASLLVEFRSKNIPTRTGFQELKINNNPFYSKLLTDYSFIRFINNNVVDQRGNYLYKISAKEYSKYKAKFQFYYSDGYEHLLFRPANDAFVIISAPVTSLLTHVTSFSYILILFAFQFAIISICLYNKKIKSGFFNLSAKIQLAFIILTILAMTLFGITTEYTISNQYLQKNKSFVSEKLLSINDEINAKFGNNNSISPSDQKLLEARLRKLSDVFHSDINFYNTNGVLLASSDQKLYRFKIASTLMNTNAFNELIVKGNPRFIHIEKIGALEFLSGYQPFYNNDKQILGYINIPFFSAQRSANSEFSSLLMAIINIFVVLLAFTVLLSVIVTQIIISPLKKIRESISSMQFNKVNKPIAYKGKDELADLVKEYNNKVAELEKFAFYLAQNERESAWREMAKQVAHEIKNPLTPMKLNIQHMQRSLKPNDPDFELKLSKISQSLIEQIDTLTNIASEFSNLAKMPGSKFEKFEYMKFVENAVELYNDNDDIKIVFEHKPVKLHVNADKEQLLRVLNNLIKNAQQAIPENKEGIIIIRIEKQENKICTFIIDNGQGIAEDQKSNIFQPNFTTKSTGSGLGLAMVKNIIEQHGGTIYFETEQGNGSTFIFELPLSE
jgi:two-component system nitrogen regulation sensor histidine kinase NtrY